MARTAQDGRVTQRPALARRDLNGRILSSTDALKLHAAGFLEPFGPELRPFGNLDKVRGQAITGSETCKK